MLMMSISINATEVLPVKSFTVSFAEFTTNVDVIIFNSKGENLFECEFSAVGIDSKTFDVSSFPDGKYVFMVRDNVKEKQTPFTIRKGKVEFALENTSMTYSPGIQQMGSLVYVNALTGADKTVRVLVEDNYNTTVFEKTYDSDVTFGKIFDLNSLPKGSYVVQVSFNNRTFSKIVAVN